MNPIKKKKIGHKELSISALRALCIDMINKANSGHPGMALDAAPIMYALYHDHLVADPLHPDWINRDRFVLSAGHASSLLYATLHLAGYNVTMDDLKSFRQLGSRAAGHPEVGFLPGIDATSGPLGQGISQAVGMAIAEKAMASQYEEGGKLIDHHTYCLCGDGCLEEGISQEAISLAGHYRLNKLILIYDENGATLDGPTSDSLTDNIKMRFLSSDWDVLEVKDGLNAEKISEAIDKAKESKTYPTLIIVHTTIGYGSAKQGSHKVHGEPLGEEDGAHAKEQYGYNYGPFEVPEEVYDDFKNTFLLRGKQAYANYQQGLKEYANFHERDYKRFNDAINRNLADYIPEMPSFGEAEATRNSSGKILSALALKMPFTMGGSADVAGSTKTNIKGIDIFTDATPSGRDLHFGIREFAMAGVCNGLALHKGIVPYCSCFLIFSDYMKPAIRMAALEHLPVMYLFTHDSIAVGEDGPTHEPIEQLPSLRATPNLDTIRPADAKECYGAYLCALENATTPTALILSRQNLPTLPETDPEAVKKGAYILWRPAQEATKCIIATGSEVALALNCAKRLEKQGIYCNVVSMPSWKRFEEQDEAYKASILIGKCCDRVSIEMSSTFGWRAYAKYNIGVDTFGASGKAKDVLASFGFDEESIYGRLLSYLG